MYIISKAWKLNRKDKDMCLIYTHIKGNSLKSILSMVWLFTALISHKAMANELTYTFDNAVGSAEFLLGSKLVPNASFGSSIFTLSSVLSEHTRAYVDLSHTQIYPESKYSSSEGELGLQMRYLNIEDNQIFAGLFAYMNRQHDSYSYYNSSGFGLYLKWKYYFKASQLIIAGYDVNFNRFEEVSEASNTDHEIHFTWNQSFPSKTSLNFRNAFAYQNFWPQTVLEGQGRFIRTIEVDPIPDKMLVTSELRLSQSLGTRIGLTLWLDYQAMLNDESALLILQDGMNNPFIDRFRWEGPSSSLRLQYNLHKNHSLKLSYSFHEKNFLKVPVYEFDFENNNYVIVDEAYVSLGMNRSDTKNSIQLYWNVNLDPSHREWVPELGIVFNAGWILNESNDLLYDFESMNYGITFNLNQ